MRLTVEAQTRHCDGRWLKKELLKEVHHRVKNNLQVIVSLLNMQSGQMEDKEVLAQFQEARNRVLAISSIHELLYHAETFAGISLVEYARQLAPGLIRFYGLDARVRLELQGDGEKLELERAVPSGMLLNELVSNACKHAFPAPGGGTILIAIRPVANDLELIVADDGKGLPEHFDYLRAASLGLKLVHPLARQLQGNVQASSEAGTTVSLAAGNDPEARSGPHGCQLEGQHGWHRGCRGTAAKPIDAYRLYHGVRRRKRCTAYQVCEFIGLSHQAIPAGGSASNRCCRISGVVAGVR